MKIPQSEKPVMTYVFDGIDCYQVTRNVVGKYTLYKILKSDYQKIKTDDSAIKFDEIVKKDRSN